MTFEEVNIFVMLSSANYLLPAGSRRYYCRKKFPHIIFNQYADDGLIFNTKKTDLSEFLLAFEEILKPLNIKINKEKNDYVLKSGN